MATETLHFENARIAQQLFSNDLRNLQMLDDELAVKATARDGWIRLEGAAEAIEEVAEMLAMAREAGFRDAVHVSAAELNERYFAGRADGLRVVPGEEFLVATAGAAARGTPAASS